MPNKELEDSVYIVNRAGMISEDLPYDIVRVRVMTHGGEGIKTVRVVGESGSNISTVLVVRGDADAYIKIANPDTMPENLKYYFRISGIRWGPDY